MRCLPLCGAGLRRAASDKRILDRRLDEAAHHGAAVFCRGPRGHAVGGDGRRIGDELAGDALAAQHRLDVGEPRRDRADAAKRKADILEDLARGIGLDERGRANRRKSPASAAARPSGTSRHSLRRLSQIIAVTISSGPSAVLPGPCMKSVDGHGPRFDPSRIQPRDFDLAIQRQDRRRAVGGGRGIDDIARERRLLPDLVVGEPDRAIRHAGQMAAQRLVFQKLLIDDIGAQPDLAALDPVAVQLA